MPPRKRKASRPASSSHDQSEREDSSSSTELNSDIPYDVLKEKGAKRLKRCSETSETFPKQMRKIEKVMEGLFNYADKLEGRMNERMRTQEERMQLEMRTQEERMQLEMRAQLGAQDERIRKEMEALTRKVQECERGWQDRLLKLKDGLRNTLGNAIGNIIDKTFENEIDPNLDPNERGEC